VHAAQHTAGDIYWWITHGIPGTAMPGFDSQIPDQQRWDLVNYLKLISYGAQSHAVVGEVTIGKPLLPSMDFAFTGGDGNEARLRDLEEQKPVLLVINGGSAFLPRLRQLQAAMPELSRAGLVVVFAAPQDIRQLLTSGGSDGASWVPADDLSPLSTIWRHYADMPDSGVETSHSEFLIDRFGYVRARWSGADQPLPYSSRLLELAAALASEPKILPTPEEHVH
jgi:putative copper resistance protein D